MALTGPGWNNSMRTGLAKAFAPKAPKVAPGSATTAAYKQKITAGFAQVPGANATTAGAPPPPPSPPSSGGAAGPPGLPPDPAYDNTVGGLTKGRDDTLAGLTGSRERGLLNYGYKASYDAAGNATGLSVDPSNPYSRQALLKQHWDQRKTGTGNSMAARGQLYSGALVNAQNANDQGYNIGEHGLQSQLLEFLAQNQGARRTATNTFETGVGQAGADRVGRIPTNPLYDPSVGVDQPAPAAAEAAPAAAPGAPKIDLSKWVKTTYQGKNSKGQPGTWHVHGDGSKVFIPK